MTLKKVFYLLFFTSSLIVFNGACKETELTIVGRIDGIVTDAHTQTPLKGANVTITPSNASQTTGEDASKFTIKQYEIRKI